MLKLLNKDTLQIEIEKQCDDGYTPYWEHETLPLTDEIRQSVRRIYQLRDIDVDLDRFEVELDEEEYRLIRLFNGPSARSLLTGKGNTGRMNFRWTWWDDIVDHNRREFVNDLVDLLHPSKTDAPAQGLIWSLPEDD